MLDYAFLILRAILVFILHEGGWHGAGHRGDTGKRLSPHPERDRLGLPIS